MVAQNVAHDRRHERAQKRPGDAREQSSQSDDGAPDERRPRQASLCWSSEWSTRRCAIANRCLAAVRGPGALETRGICHLESSILDSSRNAGQCCIELCRRIRGYSTEGARIYSTKRPCRECTKLLLEAGVWAVYYEEEWPISDAGQLEACVQLQQCFPGGVHKLLTSAVPVVVPKAA